MFALILIGLLASIGRLMDSIGFKFELLPFGKHCYLMIGSLMGKESFCGAHKSHGP